MTIVLGRKPGGSGGGGGAPSGPAGGVLGGTYPNPTFAEDPPGTELAYATKTSDTSITATAVGSADSIVSAGAVSFDGSTRVCIEFFSCALLTPGGGSTGIEIWLFDGATNVGKMAVAFSTAATTLVVPALARAFITPSNASHTYSARATVTSGTGTVTGGAGGAGNNMPAYIRVTKA